jgi:hypothetical protein
MLSKKNEMLEIDPQRKTAIIYSVQDLFEFLVEIKENGSSYFIQENDEPVRFRNIEDARRAAINEKAIVAYLAVSKIYDETGLNSGEVSENTYVYSPVQL